MSSIHAVNNITSDFTSSLLDAVPAGIIVSKANGEICYLNAESERLFRYTKEELLGKSIDLLLPERFSHGHAKLRQSYVDNPTPRYMGIGRELFGLRKDNTEFPLEIGLRPIHSDGEQLVISTIVDITARKQSDERFKQVIEASPYGKLLVDANGIIQMVNPSLLNTFGYEKNELIGKSMDILLPDRYREKHAELREGYIQKPSLRAMGSGRDLTGKHKNGTEIPIEIGLNPVEMITGKLILAVVIDISERKRLELSLKLANTHLEEFTYVASHDLKSPLRGISDLAEWITEDITPETPQSIVKNIGRIKIRIGKMERLVDDLLIYARAGKRTTESSIINIKDLINNIIELYPAPIDFKIETIIEIDFLQASKTPLETVLRNLYANAIKHHDGVTPIITIKVEPSGNFCLFRIIDNGPGIPEAAHDRVFRLFQTLNASEHASSGIGLALVKRLTESHGGHIELMSEDGKRGACFNILWPRFPRRDLDE